MQSIPQSITPTKQSMPASAANGHLIAQVSGYETPEVMAWSQACLDAYAVLTAQPHGLLAKAEPTRVAKGLDLARAGAVVDEEPYWTVEGSTGRYTWAKGGDACPCPDQKRHAMQWCKHQIAVLLHAHALSSMDAPAQPPVGRQDEKPVDTTDTHGGVTLPCPEAIYSLNLKMQVHGKDGQLTVRGQTLAEFTANVRGIVDLLQSLEGHETPAATPDKAPDAHYCVSHGLMKPSSKVPGTFYCPGKTTDGAYCKSRWPVA